VVFDLQHMLLFTTMSTASIGSSVEVDVSYIAISISMPLKSPVKWDATCE
jgi:hypothetical protein